MPFSFSCSFNEYYLFNWKFLFLLKIPTEFPTFLGSTVVLVGNLGYQTNVLYFFRKEPPSYWETLPPGKIPTGFSIFLEITPVLLENQMDVLSSSGKHYCLVGRLCLQRRPQLDLLLFWRLPRSCWKTK